LLNDGNRLLSIGVARNSTDRRNDLGVMRDDESRTFRRAMADLVSTGILHRGDGLSLIGVRHLDVIGFAISPFSSEATGHLRRNI
jgi:hypothetical protein